MESFKDLYGALGSKIPFWISEQNEELLLNSVLVTNSESTGKSVFYVCRAYGIWQGCASKWREKSNVVIARSFV